VVDNDQFDFGLLDPHATTSHTFEICNEGSICIEDRGYKLKCTVSEVLVALSNPVNRVTLPSPGIPDTQDEEYAQSATIHTNDPKRKEIELSVSGKVRAE